jgi:hypothetical protein
VSRIPPIARYIAWAVFAIFLVALWAAPMRAVLGVGIRTASLIALVPALLALAALGWRTNIVWPSRGWLLVVAAFVVLAIALLWNRRYGPLIGWIGSDGGVHVSYRDRFITDDPTIYSSFVSFYGFTWWIERIFRTDAFWSFGAAFLIVVALVVGSSVLLVANASTSADPASPRIARLANAAALSIAAIVLVIVLLPLLSYYQADGFFTQLWGLVPLLAFWLADVCGLDRLRRLVLLALSVVLVRYTYGLVLGDVFVLVPALLLIETVGAWRRHERARIGWVLATLLVSVGCAFALHLFVATMYDVLPRYGWFIEHDYAKVLRGTAFVSVALAVCGVCAPKLGRLIAVPVIVGVSNCALSYYLGTRGSQHYYLYKYNFHALVLLGMALPIAVVYVARSAGLASRWVAWGALLLAFVGLFMVARGIEPMRVLFRERAFNYEPTTTESMNKLRITPLVDLGAVQRIRKRLREEHAEFGGLLISSGPMFNFMNAELGRYGGGFFAYSRLDQSTGHCVFWTAKHGGHWAWAMPNWMKTSIAVLKQVEGAECRSYHASWDATIERDLCSLCSSRIAADEPSKEQR